MFFAVVLWMTLTPWVHGYQNGTGPDGCCNTYSVTSTCRACYFWVVYGNAEMLDQVYERVDDLSNVIPLVNGSSSNIDYEINLMSQYDGPKGWWISENKKWIIRHCDRKWNIGDVEDIRMTQWCENYEARDWFTWKEADQSLDSPESIQCPNLESDPKKKWWRFGNFFGLFFTGTTYEAPVVLSCL